MKRTLLLLWACVYAFTSVPAYGIPLGTLEGTNGSILSGDLIFDNFSSSSLASTQPGQASDIDVVPITVAGEHGLRFIGPFFGTTQQVGNTTFVELGFYDFAFDVKTTNPNLLLHNVSHSWAFTHFGEGSKQFSLTTQVRNCPFAVCIGPGEFDIQALDTSLHGNGGGGPVIPSPGILSEHAILPSNTPFLGVENDITMQAGSVFDAIATLHPTFVSVPFVEITFSQVIPEPETYAMMVAGLGLLGFMLRRRATRLPRSGA